VTAASRQRLFFALWPDAQTRDDFAHIARTHLPPGGGRPVATANVHLTLEFLGTVDASMRACAERAADALSMPAFELEFQRLGYWPRPRVLWSAPQATPEPLESLVATLREALAECGHRPEARPFRAHVTLARKVRGPVVAADHAALRWPVAAFHLMASESGAAGVHYRRLKSWPLE
jgi:RNA 2',3'-cyclic 3'-phosphodiesterase